MKVQSGCSSARSTAELPDGHPIIKVLGEEKPKLRKEWKTAAAAFKEALDSTQPQMSPQFFNLFVGLVNLTEALQIEIQELKTAIARLEAR